MYRISKKYLCPAASSRVPKESKRTLCICIYFFLHFRRVLLPKAKRTLLFHKTYQLRKNIDARG